MFDIYIYVTKMKNTKEKGKGFKKIHVKMRKVYKGLLRRVPPEKVMILGMQGDDGLALFFVAHCTASLLSTYYNEDCEYNLDSTCGA